MFRGLRGLNRLLGGGGRFARDEFPDRRSRSPHPAPDRDGLRPSCGRIPPENDLSVERPDTRYAWNSDVALAYQVVGDGPVDLLYLQGWGSNVELNWESPHLARFLSGLAGIGRLTTVDRRGWGLSERFSPADVPPMETLTEDLEVVMRAVGSDRTVIVASCECAAIAALFATATCNRSAVFDPLRYECPCQGDDQAFACP